jgi:hypothetical protein
MAFNLSGEGTCFRGECSDHTRLAETTARALWDGPSGSFGKSRKSRGKEAYHQGANLGITLFCPDRDVRVPYDQDLSGAELSWAFSGLKPQQSVERHYQSETALSPWRRRPAIPVGKNISLFPKRKLTV